MQWSVYPSFGAVATTFWMGKRRGHLPHALSVARVRGPAKKRTCRYLDPMSTVLFFTHSTPHASAVLSRLDNPTRKLSFPLTHDKSIVPFQKKFQTETTF